MSTHKTKFSNPSSWCRRKVRAGASMLVFFALASGCATVRSFAVDEHGAKKRGSREGIPYYLPRPYVAVKKPFPVYGVDTIVSGKIDKDGNLTVDAAAIPEQLRSAGLMVAAGQGAMRVSREQIYQQAKGGDAKEGEAKDGEAKDGEKKDGEAKDGEKKDDEKKDDEKKDGEAKDGEKKDGEAGAKVTANGTTSPVVPISEAFDIVYLPDFEERYVIRLRPRLGKLEANLGLQGGMLGSLGVNVDNTQVASMVTESVATVVDVAKEVALGKLLPADTEAVELHSKSDKTVSLRLRYTAEALPGIYPVLKPGECTKADTCAVASPNTPPYRFAGATLLIPIGPFTRVAYRVRHTLVVELLDAGKKSATDGGDVAPKQRNATPAEKAEVEQWIKGAKLGKSLGDVSDVLVSPGTGVLVRVTKSVAQKDLAKFEEALKQQRKAQGTKAPATLRSGSIAIEGGAG